MTKAPPLLLSVALLLFGGSMLSARFLVGRRERVPTFTDLRLVGGDTRKIALGRALFVDRRLSMSGRRSCASCHDVSTNGASPNRLDRVDSGQPAAFNTPTVFNSVYNYRFGWTGRGRTLRDQVLRGMNVDLTDGSDIPIGRLRGDPALARRFEAVYGTVASEVLVADALAAYVSSLVTPDAPFDRWLRGDRSILTPRQTAGFYKFTALGCAGCHQGRNLGGNIVEPTKTFHLGERAIRLRVPGLRNVAATAPYFHDGRIATLPGAVRECARDQLDLAIPRDEVDAVTAFLKALSGERDGKIVTSARRP